MFQDDFDDSHKDINPTTEDDCDEFEFVAGMGSGRRSVPSLLCGGLRLLELGFARGTHYFEEGPLPLRMRVCQPTVVSLAVAGVCPL